MTFSTVLRQLNICYGFQRFKKNRGDSIAAVRMLESRTPIVCCGVTGRVSFYLKAAIVLFISRDKLQTQCILHASCGTAYFPLILAEEISSATSDQRTEYYTENVAHALRRTFCAIIMHSRVHHMQCTVQAGPICFLHTSFESTISNVYHGTMPQNRT